MFPLRIPIFPHAITLRQAIMIVSIAILSLVFFIASQPVVSRSNTDSSGAFSINPTQSQESSVHSGDVSTAMDTPVQEVHIANNGLMLLRGARVVSKYGSTVRVAMKWGTAEFTWSIWTDSSTNVFAADGQKETLKEVQTGDIVTITGQLLAGGTEPKVLAQFIRE